MIRALAVFYDLDRDRIPLMKHRARWGILPHDAEKAGPRQAADGGSVGVWVCKCDADLSRHVSPDMKWQPDHVRDGHLPCQSFVHALTIRANGVDRLKVRCARCDEKEWGARICTARSLEVWAKCGQKTSVGPRALPTSA